MCAIIPFGSRWQHQFWDRFVRHAREFTEWLEYMHMNPVRRGVIEKPEQWRWPSYNNFSLEPSVWPLAQSRLTTFTSLTITAFEDETGRWVATIEGRF
jgi:putative transposase